jgi:hypothetical protein
MEKIRSPKRRFLKEPHGVPSQKTVLLTIHYVYLGSIQPISHPDKLGDSVVSAPYPWQLTYRSHWTTCKKHDNPSFLCLGNEGDWEHEDPAEVERISVGGGLEDGTGEQPLHQLLLHSHSLLFHEHRVVIGDVTACIFLGYRHRGVFAGKDNTVLASPWQSEGTVVRS